MLEMKDEEREEMKSELALYRTYLNIAVGCYTLYRQPQTVHSGTTINGV